MFLFVEIIGLWIVDGLEPQLEAAHVEMGIWYNRGAGCHMDQKGEAMTEAGMQAATELHDEGSESGEAI